MSTAPATRRLEFLVDPPPSTTNWSMVFVESQDSEHGLHLARSNYRIIELSNCRPLPCSTTTTIALAPS